MTLVSSILKNKEYCFSYLALKKKQLSKDLKEVWERAMSNIGGKSTWKVLRQVWVGGRTRRPVWVGQREESRVRRGEVREVVGGRLGRGQGYRTSRVLYTIVRTLFLPWERQEALHDLGIRHMLRFDFFLCLWVPNASETKLPGMSYQIEPPRPPSYHWPLVHLFSAFFFLWDTQGWLLT